MKHDPPRDFLDWLGIKGAPKWHLARPIGPVFSLILALLFLGAIAAAFAVIFHTITNAFGAKAAGPSLGAGAMIAALLGAPFVIWATVLKQKTVEFQKEGHITDRINKAVEMLGAEKTVIVPALAPDGRPGRNQNDNMATTERTVPNLEVRFGALLSLERIAQDSTNYDKGRDHVRVMEILCAYVRENAKAKDARDFPLPDWDPLSDDASDAEKAHHEMWRKTRFKDRFGPNAREWARVLPPPRADIQLALTILGRRNIDQRHVEARWGPDASPDAEWVFDAPCPDLPEPPEDAPHGPEKLAAFKKGLADWQKKLQGYRGYRLDLRGTNLQRADLSHLILSGARLEQARMEGAVLIGARMEGAVLIGARMEGAVLRKARMEGADLRAARMDSSTYLTAAAFQGAAVREVDWSSVNLSQEQINALFGDASVTRPEDMEKPDHWPGWELPLSGENGFYTQWLLWQSDPDTYTPPPEPPAD